VGNFENVQLQEYSTCTQKNSCTRPLRTNNFREVEKSMLHREKIVKYPSSYIDELSTRNAIFCNVT